MRLIRLVSTVLVSGSVACGPSTLEPLELQATLTANPTTAAVNQPITVVLDAQGTRLLSLRIDYGDESEPDFLGVAGSRTARWTRTHVYTQAGTYVISGRIDESTDTLTRTVSVTVNPVAGPAAEAISGVFRETLVPR